ncbi:MAG: amidohydrolase family protein [Cyclobacteriaceae bacterium]
MVIDAHQHFWKYHPVKDAWITDEMKVIQRDFMPSDLHGTHVENKIDGCVAVQADQSEEETVFLIEQANKNNFIKGVVGWVDFRASDVEERLIYFSKSKIIKGFRHIVQAEQDDAFLLRDDFCKGIGLLEKYNFTYDVLIKPKHLICATEFVQRFPNQKFVIDHLAKPFIKDQLIDQWKKDIQRIARNENVLCKISGMVTEAHWKNWKQEDFKSYLDVVFDAFGTDRVMYGSDWPVCLVAASYQQQLNIITNYLSSFSVSDQEKIMGGNAIHFYKL